MNRSMNYDLDGVFASRNQGQLLASTQGIVRTPGLQQVRSSTYRQPSGRSPFYGLGAVSRAQFNAAHAAAANARIRGGVAGYVKDRTQRLNGMGDAQNPDDITTSSDVDDQSTVPAVPVPGSPAPAVAAPAPAKDNTKLYLALGAAAAAYFLFFRK